jgi:hypothetical protein
VKDYRSMRRREFIAGHRGLIGLMRIRPSGLLLLAVLGFSPALAQEGTREATTDNPAITMPKPIAISRFVPSGEERNIGFVVALFPDCSSRGLTVGRLVKPPAHGTMTFAAAESFSTYPATSRLASCNERKSPGLNITYKSNDAYVGEDEAEIFLIFPDGSGAEWHYLILVR